MSRINPLKVEILKHSGVEVSTRFINCMVAEDIEHFQQVLELTPEQAIRIPNFGTACVKLLKEIQQSQDPSLHQNNKHLLMAVKEQTVQLIVRLRQEIPAFNTLFDDEQVKIVTGLRLKQFDAFKEAALRRDGIDSPQRILREVMKTFDLE